MATAEEHIAALWGSQTQLTPAPAKLGRVMATELEEDTDGIAEAAGTDDLEARVRHTNAAHILPLLAHPEVLLISLARFQYSGERIRKRRNRVTLLKCGQLPFFDQRRRRAPTSSEPAGEKADQRTTLDISYNLIGGIIHIGDRAHTGRYRAFEVHNKTLDCTRKSRYTDGISMLSVFSVVCRALAPHCSRRT